MNSIFTQQEKEWIINQIKIGLLSRFYPLSKDDIIQYQDYLDMEHLMYNDDIHWDYELIDNVLDKIDWQAVHKFNHIVFDIDFFNRYESYIDYHTIQYAVKKIEWSEELLDRYGDRFDWTGNLILKPPLSTVENIRKYKDKLDWIRVSRDIDIDFNDDILEEFKDKWDWKALSSNRHLPLNLEFVQKHIDKLDFNNLSSNPACLPLIMKYHQSEKWNWERVILNWGLEHNKDTLKITFYYFKKQLLAKYEKNKFIYKIYEKNVKSYYLNLVLRSYKVDTDFFLSEQFLELIDWDVFSMTSNVLLPLEIVERYKNKIRFNEFNFIYHHKEIITLKFIKENIELFDKENFKFSYLPIDLEIIEKMDSKYKWLNISGNISFDWSWQFIEENIDDLPILGLIKNVGIYKKLDLDKLNKGEIQKILKKGICNYWGRHY